MQKEDIYRFLEEKLPRYLDFVEIPTHESSEPFCAIESFSGLKTRQIDPRMHSYTGDLIYVRKTVLDKLKNAALLLKEYDASFEIEVVYGYRALEIQIQMFNHFASQFEEKLSGTELFQEVHKYIAVPEVAGHPTGGAVDVQLIKEKDPLNFGTNIWEFTEDSLTFSPFISKDAWKNRQLLRHVMVSSGFAPFDGEWWHFSYGDKEWAKFYNKSHALYGQTKSSMIPIL